MRLNAVYNDGEGARERSGSDLQGAALALRWKISSRTTVDVMAERANERDGTAHGVLTDDTTAYVRGTGTIALDANPNLPGVQINGVGTAQMTAAGNVQLFTLIGGKIYNLESTPTATFRYSRVDNGSTAAALEINPLRLPRISAPESLVPRYQDWGGPMNFFDLRWRTVTVEVRHEFSPAWRGLSAVNHQRDANVRPRTTLDDLQSTFAGRGIFIDVNPSLLDVSDPANPRLVPNPHYEKPYIAHGLSSTNDGHTIDNVRALGVYDAPCPGASRSAPC